jgi:membrane protein
VKIRLLRNLTVKQLALRTYRRVEQDNCLSTAAELAYYFLLALFPLLILLTGLVGYLPGVQALIMQALAKAMPEPAMKLVHDTLNDVTKSRSTGLLSFGALAAIWAASSGVSALMSALNRTRDASERRSYWTVRSIAIGLTIAFSLLVTGGAVMIMFADKFSLWLARSLGLGETFRLLTRLAQYLAGLAGLLVGIDIIYYLGPSARSRWRWITVGSAFTVGACILVSFGLSVYLRFAPSYSATYGSLGAVVVLMLWLYLMGLMILVGSEINHEIEMARADHHRDTEEHREHTEKNKTTAKT